MTMDGATSAPPNGDRADEWTLGNVVMDSSLSLMGAHPDEFETKLLWSLENVSTAFGADRCGVYRTRRDAEESALVLDREWSADGVESHGSETDVLDEAAYPWLFKRLAQFHNAKAIPLSAVPADASAFRELLDDADVQAALFLPLVSEWSLLGAVSFESVNVTAATSPRAVDHLGTFGDMLGHALARTRRERELRRKNDRLDEFASVVSHDLRNPLNVVQASIEMARRDPAPEHFDRGAEAANRMERIVGQVLALARVGRDIGETEPVDPADVAARAWDSIHVNDATLEVGDCDVVDADRDRLVEAFENIFRNAVDHGGPDVTVRVFPLDDADGFCVEDDGPGIPAEERDQVFERGYTTDDDGTGFGLSIVSRIVEAHDWGFAVDSAEFGGARFEVRTDAGGGLSG